LRSSITRSLGLDIGDRRIGIALSDPLGILASPFTVLESQDEITDIKAILDITGKYSVEKIIVGLPQSMDGSIGAQAEKVKTWVDHFVKHTTIPVEFRDERLTTVSAKRLSQDARVKKTKKKIEYDAMAAAIILQGYLDESPRL
jgi:putative holliday junction resolvase